MLTLVRLSPEIPLSLPGAKATDRICGGTLSISTLVTRSLPGISLAAAVERQPTGRHDRAADDELYFPSASGVAGTKVTVRPEGSLVSSTTCDGLAPASW